VHPVRAGSGDARDGALALLVSAAVGRPRAPRRRLPVQPRVSAVPRGVAAQGALGLPQGEEGLGQVRPQGLRRGDRVKALAGATIAVVGALRAEALARAGAVLVELDPEEFWTAHEPSYDLVVLGPM